MSRRSPNLAQPLCPVCREPVVKATVWGQRSYSCSKHWGPWSKRIWNKTQLARTAPDAGKGET